MNIKSSLRYLATLLFAATAAAALAFADIGAYAQNTNSSTTGEDSAQNTNANMGTGTTRRGRRGRRGARRAGANANAGDMGSNTGDMTGTENANTGDQNANMGGEATTGTGAGRRGRRGRRGRGRANAADTTTTDTGTGADTGTGTGTGTGQGMGQGTGEGTDQSETTGDLSGERSDLSGTYTGRVTMSGGHEMSGQGTLTITGNTFTLESGGTTHSGRVYAVVTRGYVGAAFYFTDIADPATNTPVVANVRARKVGGDRLSLSPVPGSRTRLTFGAGGGGRGSR